jgi:asparaginyl-tRNA synthetase
MKLMRSPTDSGRENADNATVDQIELFNGKKVTLRGWVANLRSSGKICFLQLRDGTGIIQCVADLQSLGADRFQELTGASLETSLVIEGTVREDKRSKIGFEIGLSDFKIFKKSEEYPIAKKEHGVAFLMDNRHLWLRSSRQVAVLRVRSEIIRAVRDYFDGRGFYLVGCRS